MARDDHICNTSKLIRLVCPKGDKDKNALTQWDANRQVFVPECTEVHFARQYGSRAYVVLPYETEEHLVADIPNQVLTCSGTLMCWAVKEETAIVYATFPVKSRPKPDDYVYEPTEIVDVIEMITNLDTRVTALENEGPGKEGLPALIGAVSVYSTEGDSYGDVKLADETTNTWDIDLYISINADRAMVREFVDERMDEYSYEINDKGHLIQTRN